MEAYALGMTLGIPQKEAEKLVQGYLDGFPELKSWRENSRKQVKEHGRITNFVGRIRHIPKVKRIYDRYGERIMDWKFRNELAANTVKMMLWLFIEITVTDLITV